MPQYKSNFICTDDSMIEVGQQYQYKESMPNCIYDVTCIKDESDEFTVSLRLRIDKVIQGEGDVGEIFDFSYSREFSKLAYMGMSRLYAAGAYMKLFRNDKR